MNSSQGKINYAVIGTGALGGYYGGMLARAGLNVHFLFHSDYEFAKENGLRVDSVNGNFLIKPVNAYQSTNLMPVCDVILVCLKTMNNYLLKDLLPPLLHKDTVIILMQNGLGIEEELAEYFPQHSIAGGMAFICSSKVGNGHIAHYDYGSIRIGFHQRKNEELEKQIRSDFTKAGITIEIAPDLNQARWQKLVWNIPYNGMTVVLNTTTDRLMKNPDSRRMVRDLMMEVINAAGYCKAQIGEDFVETMMKFTDAMTPYAPSMKLDYDAKRPMEIQAIYTNPVKTALKAGFDMKKVAMVEQELRFLQSTY
ncbi:MAG: putative 2-dehydropantoate 2-reductase [Smithella sp.]